MTDTVLISDEGALQVLKVNDAGDDLVGKTIMYKWHEFGWCVGKIARRNGKFVHCL